jgi:hypothetical protein
MNGECRLPIVNCRMKMRPRSLQWIEDASIYRPGLEKGEWDEQIVGLGGHVVRNDSGDGVCVKSAGAAF